MRGLEAAVVLDLVVLLPGQLGVAGLPNSVAVWAALLYRTVTFWIPTVPGWVAFHYLQKQDAI